MIFDLGFILSIFGDPRLWIAITIFLIAARVVLKKKGIKKLLWVREFVLFVGVPMGLAFLVSTGFKELFKIPRPCTIETNPHCLNSYSFPSGHSTTAFAAITGLFLMLKEKKHVWLYIFAFLAAWGRILLEVHTVADVVAGAALGIGFSAVYRKVLIKYVKV